MLDKIDNAELRSGIYEYKYFTVDGKIKAGKTFVKQGKIDLKGLRRDLGAAVVRDDAEVIKNIIMRISEYKEHFGAEDLKDIIIGAIVNSVHDNNTELLKLLLDFYDYKILPKGFIFSGNYIQKSIKEGEVKLFYWMMENISEPDLIYTKNLIYIAITSNQPEILSFLIKNMSFTSEMDWIGYFKLANFKNKIALFEVLLEYVPEKVMAENKEMYSVSMESLSYYQVIKNTLNFLSICRYPINAFSEATKLPNEITSNILKLTSSAPDKLFNNTVIHIAKVFNEIKESPIKTEGLATSEKKYQEKAKARFFEKFKEKEVAACAAQERRIPSFIAKIKSERNEKSLGAQSILS